MNYTVLIVEDDERIAAWTKVYMERAGFGCEVSHDGETGLALARELCPDLIVLDLMLPGSDGMAVCRILRSEADVPIIMLTAKGAQADRICGLEGGADDYVVKPFDPDELVARANAVLRRVAGKAQQVLTCDRLVLTVSNQRATLDGEPMHLGPA